MIPKLTVVGVGLIGGSLALALKAAGLVGEVVGVGRGRANLETAVERGVIDRFTHDVGEGVEGADLVFLSTPVQTLARVAAEALPRMKRGAVLTDGGSVKQYVIEQIEPLLPAGVHFVPGHPIAGTERTGSAAAFATLYQGRRCILTPTEKTDPGALDLVTKAWQGAGSEVVIMDADRHDRVLAAVSHLPHMVAYALVNTVACENRFGENILHYSAGGFRDFTRIASSDPTMWRDIAQTNREALLEVISYFETVLQELKSDIAAGDGESLFNFFLRSKESRDAIL
ncbi:MAG: prephenate dehydrogenase/arogenate dehydrogenase family protein [Syntrophotaleaceae bacterium]